MTMDVSIREISCNEAASHQSQLDQKQQKSSFGEDTHAYSYRPSPEPSETTPADSILIECMRIDAWKEEVGSDGRGRTADGDVKEGRSAVMEGRTDGESRDTGLGRGSEGHITSYVPICFGSLRLARKCPNKERL
ncbi:unnamed protein product [Heligmosomoides polygyrus]|uniref:Uncharacterized protein n=1 Tax=Heligmosomoides polygyrus TaxID=6339 RepID=A0A183F1Y2_HELPZ|nr:unnamed protein product [Heligmosomoides polygyrus]